MHYLIEDIHYNRNNFNKEKKNILIIITNKKTKFEFSFLNKQKYEL